MTDQNQINSDAEVRQILGALEPYKSDHPRAQIDARRRNVVSIHIRVIDPDFEGMDRVEREPPFWKLLKTLPEEVFLNITMLLLLAPEECERSFANMEFENPIPSRL